jgi:hypothetical protein
VLRELVDYRAVANHLAAMVSGLDIRYETGSSNPLVGRRLSPDTELDVPGRGRVRVAELLHPARGVLINTEAAGWADRVDTITGIWSAALPEAVLLRPDGYVAWAPGDDDLTTELTRWFGTPSAAADRSAA